VGYAARVVAVAEREPRVRCARCRRPTVVCYCAALPRIETATKIVILQHPRERDMAIGTARMASLCLPNAELLIGLRWNENQRLAAALADPTRTPILLYPGPGARDILAEPPHGPVTLIAVDGTWSQAKTLVRDNPILHSLPRYAFVTPEPSHYRIRKEPRDEYCSTIEALMHALGALEGNPERFRALLDPFHAMVDAQLAHQAARPLRRFRVPKPAVDPVTKLPAAVTDRYADLVVLSAEANAWPYAEPVPSKRRKGPKEPPDELVHLVALRPATGERFDRIAAPAGALAPSTSFHCGIPVDQLLAGQPREDVIAAFNRWLRPTDIVATWGYYSPDLVLAAGGSLGERLDLRFTAQRLLHRRLGSLEDFAASLGPSAPLAAGRAGRRLGALAQIVASWRASR
jgi:DTW domain-containing protein YfiP